MKKKMLSLLLSFVMVFTMIPFSEGMAFADDEPGEYSAYYGIKDAGEQGKILYISAVKTANSNTLAPNAMNSKYQSDVPWAGFIIDPNTSVKKIIIENNLHPISMSYWFSFFEHLTSIEGLGKIDTSHVTNMEWMFHSAKSLKTLNLSSFDTSNVKSMWGMFEECSNLTKLNVSSFDTRKVTRMPYMFAGCSSLTTLDLSSFEILDGTDVRAEFARCSNLKTIFATSKTFKKIPTSSCAYLFNGCTSLVGGKGTKYDSKFIDGTYARIDGGKDNPGYFTGCRGEHSVKYQSNNGKKISDAKNLAYTDAVKLPNVQRNGYVLSGWYSDSKFKNRVKAKTKYGSIAKSKTKKSITLYAKWVKVSSVKGLKVKSKTKNSVTLCWKKQSNIAGYQIYMNGKRLKSTISAKTTSKKITGLKPARKYKFQIRAIKKLNGNTGYSVLSKAIKVTTKKK